MTIQKSFDAIAHTNILIKQHRVKQYYEIR